MKSFTLLALFASVIFVGVAGEHPLCDIVKQWALANVKFTKSFPIDSVHSCVFQGGGTFKVTVVILFSSATTPFGTLDDRIDNCDVVIEQSTESSNLFKLKKDLHNCRSWIGEDNN
jgi:hypothetical protein